MDKLNVLLVDDDPNKLLTYDAILSDLGENLIKAQSGKEALHFMLKTDVAIMLADVLMPEMDGFQLADLVREHPRFKDTAIIFVSAIRMTDEDRLRGYEHGAVDYVSVPIVPEILRAKVRVFAELFRKKRQLEALYNEIRQLSGRMIMAQDEERRRIARELHDSLGQQLTAAKLAADFEHAEETSALLDDALRQVRSISLLLHPPTLDDIGLRSAVQWYLEGLTKRSGVETVLETEPQDLPRLELAFETALYRIIQEAVTNAFRHSGASRIAVLLKSHDDSISLSVQDNGKGIPDEIAQFRPGAVGVGIGGMRQRVAELGGELRLLHAKPGTKVEVRVPRKTPLVKRDC